MTKTANTLSDKSKAQQQPLTRKQQAFVNHLLENPKASATAAAKTAYNTNTEISARAIASENLTKPNIVMALSKANNRVEQVLMNTVDEWGESDNTRRREIAINTAQYIHDKVHGKSKQQIDIQSTSVNIAIDMSVTDPYEGSTDDEIVDV